MIQPRDLVHTTVCMETPPLLYNEPPSGIYIVEKIHPPVDNALRCPVCKERPEYGISIKGWNCGPGGFNSCCFRPLDDSDKQRITDKYKLPKRSLVKDDDAARKRIEELNREVRG